ncbi:Usher syndrome type-1G protein-like [Tropilaelaps mercedesae]|uniref:Usher syndrome type-1G protein-like n=1 Tax=Tropilaelaps mercedesae TaxID=418985 RepID=A0A1V9XTM9_9ACAR|nr:Usher syndrome type-1G protein-like [Tropilaelaps mercedesae]
MTSSTSSSLSCGTTTANGGDKFHAAAVDNFLDILRETTRRDCNAPDDDGLTPTLLAAYHGNLDALRLLVGRGGDPEKCDLFGQTALHLAAAKGHMNCVSFLVNFGINLFALDNEFHTAKEVALINQREDILHFLDTVIAKESALNTKVVQKLKEKAIRDAEKRVKKFEKMTHKSVKKAERDHREEQRQRRKHTLITDSLTSANCRVVLPPGGSGSPAGGQSQKFSEIVSTINGSSRRGFGAVVSKKILNKRVSTSIQALNEHGAGKVLDPTRLGQLSIRSKVDNNDVIYAAPSNLIYGRLSNDTNHASTEHISGVNEAFSRVDGANGRLHMNDVFEAGSLTSTCSDGNSNHFSQVTSNQSAASSGLGCEDSSPLMSTTSSIFERPGFGSVAFRNSLAVNPTLTLAASSALTCNNSSSTNNGASRTTLSPSTNSKSSSTTSSGSTSAEHSSEESATLSGSDSIGSVGSLVQRNNKRGGDLSDVPLCIQVSSWDDERTSLSSVDEDANPVYIFLSVHHLQEYYSIFEREKIDLDALLLLNEADLQTIGLPLGPRKKLANAIEIRRAALDKPDEKFVDSRM